jgi:hypothetical protein
MKGVNMERWLEIKTSQGFFGLGNGGLKIQKGTIF